MPELGFSWRLAVSDPLPRGSRFAFVPALLRDVFCLRTGALFFSFRGSKRPLRQLVKDRFLPCLSSDLGGVWPFRIHCPEVPVLRSSRLGCVLGLLSSPLGVPKVPLRQLVRDRFLPCLSSDLAGVRPFRTHCPEAPVLRLSRLCCITFFVYVLGLSSSPLRVPKVPLRQLVNDRFLPCLSSDLGGVWPFRIHCPEGLRTGVLFFSFRGSKGATSAA